MLTSYKKLQNKHEMALKVTENSENHQQSINELIDKL